MQTRKFVAYLSACVLAVALMCLVGSTAASGQKGAETPTEQSSGVPVVGTWQATRLDWKDPDGDDMDETALEERQKQSESGFYITFKADGIGAFYAEDLEYQVSWKSSGDAVTFPLVWSSVILTGNQTNTADENSDIVGPDILFSSSIDTPEELAFYQEFFSQEM